jgi:transcription initiation factor TFIIH subunit 2
MASNYFAWEDGLPKSWDVLLDESDAILTLDTSNQLPHYWNNAFKEALKGQMKRGMVRHTVVVIDASMYTKNLSYLLGLCRKFTLDYFDENPVSQLGFLLCRDGLAYILSEMSSNSEAHLDRCVMAYLHEIERQGLEDRESSLSTNSVLFECKGNPSLQNSLILARHQLNTLASAGLKANKEIIILYSGLVSVDPFDIYTTIQELKKDFIRVSIICQSGELAICDKICRETQGRGCYLTVEFIVRFL